MNVMCKTTRKRLSLPKRILFSACLFVLAAAGIELVSGIALWFFGNPFDIARIRDDRKALINSIWMSEQKKREVLHPYLGWVMNPKAKWNKDNGRITPNEFGLMDDKSPLQKRGANKLIVGLCGGSVAMNLGLESAAVLQAALQDSPRFRDREIVLVRLGLGGYKQPQQLLLLTYLLSQGAEFDLVINLDGFNEVALHESENMTQNTHPSFPRHWRYRMQFESTSTLVHTVYRYSTRKASRREMAIFFQGLPWQTSWTLNLVWKCLDSRSAEFLQQDLHAILTDNSAKDDYQITGPPMDFDTTEAMYAGLVTLWADSSRQMHRLCAANGIEYQHFLQPNQYYSGSKPMTDDEVSVAILADFEPGKSAAVAYPLLVIEGERLTEQGIQFHDLSMIFAQTTEPMYCDYCCHFNHEGNDRLARAIGDQIARDRGDPADSTRSGHIQGLQNQNP